MNESRLRNDGPPPRYQCPPAATTHRLTPVTNGCATAITNGYSPPSQMAEAPPSQTAVAGVANLMKFP